ncbi:MAG: hypothetical protein JRN69_06290 [Nitrososphaerota archaeon]|nr:hypothetical protein [Nitrososphaerota archaeon]
MRRFPGSGRAALAMAAAALLAVSTSVPSLAAWARPQAPELVPTVPVPGTHPATLASSPGAPMLPPGHPLAGQPSTSGLYDEQLGITFTQGFLSMLYNVTAVPQTDQVSGTGPAYLLNGVTTSGYWYQVGVSWDWSPGQGFSMNYEVFGPSGASVYPSAAGSGLVQFKGQVSPGDTIALNLYFRSGQVVMLAVDRNSSAYATESYSAEGATSFVGSPLSTANGNGFFTGLMTEWYHGDAYFGNQQATAYTTSLAQRSAWMWMDEFNASDYTPIFASNTTAPVRLGSTAFQGFSYNGTTEYADASELVTGALSDPAAAASAVPLVLSYAVRGGAAGSSPPALSYVSGGAAESVPLTGEPTLYFPGRGTGWSVPPTLGGSNATRRWATDQTVAGVASSPASGALTYYAQDLVDFRFTVDGGGSGFSPPTVGYSSFGKAATAPAGAGVWADSGSGYRYQNPLAGSTGEERWFAEPAGTVAGPGQVEVAYYHQYFVTFDVSFRDTGIIPALAVESTFAGSPYTAGVVAGANGVWLDAGAAYSFPSSFPFGAGERFLLNGTSSGEVAGSSVVGVVYEHQFYVRVERNAPAGGTVSPAAGWYDSGAALQLDAVPSQGWQFEGWQGAGPGSASGPQPRLSVTVGPAAPSNETAVFYPGVVISAEGPSSVSYRDGGLSGTVPSGAEEVAYVPPGTSLSLEGSSVPPWTGFSGWSGAVDASSSGAAVVVGGPLAVTGRSAYDVPGIAGSLLLLAVAAWGGASALRRRRKRRAAEAPGRAPGLLSRRTLSSSRPGP